jgi:uncharacterized membrane protein YvlD (DUF360 family)
VSEPAERDTKRSALRVLLTLVVDACALLLASAILPGFDLGSSAQAVGLALALGLVSALVAPFLMRIALPVTVVTLGLAGLAITGGLITLAVRLYGRGVRVESIWTGLGIALTIAVVNSVITALLAIDDDDFWYRNSARRQGRRAGYSSTSTESEPGLLLLEIDGLAYDVLRLAVRAGSAPTMARWLHDGEFRLFAWECDWSSQTGAMQAGILHGSNFDMPAFRWWEKERGRSMVTNHPRDAAEIERRHSNGAGLLHAGGASRGNAVSGDADYSMLTMSTVLTRRGGPIGRDYYAYFANPYSVVRTLSLVVAEICTELWQQTRQRRLRIRPRVHRGWFPYPLLRSFTNVILRDLAVAATIQDLYAGRPAIYTLFLGYDEVAHHSGVERAETLRELTKIDRQIARLARIARDAPRPYEIVVLSDHGQTQGATFRQRFGATLEQVVSELTAAAVVEAAGQGDEGWGYLNAAATEVSAGAGVVSAGVRAATRHARADDGETRLGAARDETGRRTKPSTPPSGGLPEIVVQASGCLGLISFPHEPGRVTLERIEQLYPRLLAGLRAHPGIGFVLVRSAEHGATVLGSDGVRYLSDDRIEGRDPLGPFGPNAADHLRRTDSFPHCADIALNSTYWPETGEVAAFEELVGSHGGMGGSQEHAFVLHPASLATPAEPVVGAEQLHLVLRGWLAALGHDEFSGPFAPAAARV